MIISPAVATSQTTPAPAVASRAPADVGDGSSQLAGEWGPLAVIALVAVIFGAALIISDDDGPSSP
ncbi:MAG: hypothetical protein AB7H79_06920 [Sphingomonas sp.]